MRSSTMAKSSKMRARRSAGMPPLPDPQPYYLDFTDPSATKGRAFSEISRLLAIPELEIGVIGDGRNDIAMFERSGLSIAMGNGSEDVRPAADFVTDGNSQDGFAKAIAWFILGGHRSNNDGLSLSGGSHPGESGIGVSPQWTASATMCRRDLQRRKNGYLGGRVRRNSAEFLLRLFEKSVHK